MGVPLLACLFSTLLLAEVTSAAAETMKVSTTPIFPQIPWGQTKKNFQVLVSVEAPPATEKTRLPIDLVVVIDVGGGMEKPSRLDLVKKAMDQFVIRQLHDKDRIAFVGPTSSHSLLGISGDGRKNARQNVAELEARTGDTEFTSHLKKAVQILEEQQVDSRNRARFILLLTDGKNSSEIPGGLEKYPVHTLGLSAAHEPKAAHDPRALFSIAQKSRGTYSFVEDDDLGEITGALAVYLGGLKNVVAVDTRVTLKVADPSAVTIEGIESGGYERSNDKTSGEIAIRALYAGEVKNFIVHLDVGGAQSLDRDCDLQQLLTVSFNYGGDTAPISNVVCIQRPQGVDAVPKAPFPVVVNHIVRFELLQIVANFVAQNELGSPDLAGKKLLSEWEEFVQVHQFWSGLDVLVGLEVEINAMVSSLEKGGSSGLAHIYSWLSSYQMQRPTAMGSPGKVVAVFVTLEVKLMLEVYHQCVDAVPPKFLQSGLGSNTYNLTSAYPEIWIEAINQVISQMYLAVLKASNLSQCGVLMPALE